MFRSIMRGIALSTALALVGAGAPVKAGSLSVEPLFVEIAPGQSGAVRVKNAADAPITVELAVAERSVDATGKQQRTAKDDDFVLFPPQGVIAPNTVQVFRFQTIAPAMDASRSYFLTVRQVPVELAPREGGGVQLQLIFAFDVAVHVVPIGARPTPQLISAVIGQTTVSKVDASPQPPRTRQNRAEEQDIVPAVIVTLKNAGNKYLYLQDMSFEATATTADGKKVSLPAWDINAIIDAAKVTLVQPGATRVLALPVRGFDHLKTVEVKLRLRGPG